MVTKQKCVQPKVFTSSLALIAGNYALRCDAKQADTEVLQLDHAIRSRGYFELGAYLPSPFVKGVQPNYLDQSTDDSVPVVNTLSIQNLSLQVKDCRHITLEDFEETSPERVLRKNDVLLTVDGGVSIGKPCLFDSEDSFITDSHVVVLRPLGISPLGLVYLLASPMGQVQFKRAESGASGQTTVTEDDIRRFIFPKSVLSTIDKVALQIEKERLRIQKQRQVLTDAETALWQKLEAAI